MTRREVFSEEKAGLFIYVRGKYSSQELYCPFIAVIGMVLCCMNLDPTKDKKGDFSNNVEACDNGINDLFKIIFIKSEILCLTFEKTTSLWGCSTLLW